jgi:DNA-binding IclR family transcriptional regulator
MVTSLINYICSSYNKYEAPCLVGNLTRCLINQEGLVARTQTTQRRSTTRDSQRAVREVKSAARSVDVLELLAARRNRPVGLRELSETLGAPRSSVYALMRTLVEHGWVRTDETGQRYSIGIRALLAGTTYLDTDPFLRIVQPHITELSAKLDETIHFARLEGTDVVYLATRESSQYLRPFSRVGRRLPAFATSLGKSLLAEQPDPEAHLPAELEPLTPATITDRDALAAELEETRRRGYAIDHEENVTGLMCFGFALRYATPATDAISCSLPLDRARPDREDVIIEAMEATRMAIEQMAPDGSA